MDLSNTTKTLMLIIALTLLGALLRIEEMGSPIIGDLAGMLFMHFPSSWDSLLFNYRDTNQRTLYIFLAKLSSEVFGDNEFTLRLPEFLAGVFALPLAYRVGLFITSSKFGASIGTLLLTFSSFHLFHTRFSKGYSLTVLLALLTVLVTYKLLSEKNFKIWGVLFFLTGLGMILIVPSNINFLVGIGVFYVLIIFKNYKDFNYAFKDIFKLIWPMILLFGVIVGYFLFILKDLKRAIAGEEVWYNSIDNIGVDFNLERFTEFSGIFIAPWGAWLYIFLLIGLVRLYKTKAFTLFVSLIFLPIIITMISGLMGPARVYIYWLPFILLFIGFGIAEFLVWIQSKRSNILAYSLGAVILAIIVFYPLATYSDNLSKISIDKENATSFKDAKAAKVFIEENTSKYDLIVVPYFDLILRYHLEEVIAYKMLNIMQEGKLGKILFLGSSETPPHEFPNTGGKSATNLMKNHSFKLIQKFGNLSMYDLGLSIRKLSPARSVEDYENNIQFQYDKAIKVEHMEHPKITGSKALKVINPFSDKEVILISKEVESFNVSNDNSYILTSFARGYQESSIAALLLQKNKSPPGIIFLNAYYGIFASQKSNLIWKRIDPYKNIYLQPNDAESEKIDFVWEMIFTIYPVPKGELGFLTGLRSSNSVSHYDGFQSFILEPQSEIN